MVDDEHRVDQGEEVEEKVEDGYDHVEHGKNDPEFFPGRAEENLTSTPGNTLAEADVDDHILIDINRFRKMFLK